MKRPLSPVLSALIFGLSGSAFGASIVTISFDSGFQFLRDNSGNLLTGGTALNGNGAVIQLGYYSQATAANNFLGTWIPLSGEGSLNVGMVGSSGLSFNDTTIGDLSSNGAGDGQFALSLTFTVGDVATGNSLPASTSIPLAIRFYDDTTIATSDFFNVVSNDMWLWKTPADAPNNPLINMSLDDTNVEWQGGAGSALKTTLPVPEPSAFVLLASGMGVLALRRRRAA